MDDMFLSPARYKLAEQVHQTTMNWLDKFKVMESITLATRVLASRHIVMKSLALAAIQPPDKIAQSLEELGLADVKLLVKLLYLSVSSKLFMPKQADSKTILDEVSLKLLRKCHVLNATSNFWSPKLIQSRFYCVLQGKTLNKTSCYTYKDNLF